MHESERNRLIKLEKAMSLAAADMTEVIAATEMLDAESEDYAKMLACETAIAVAYARAFTQSTLYKLPHDDYRPDDLDLAWLHDELYRLRRLKYAHTDKDSGRQAIQVMVDFDPDTRIANMGWQLEWEPLPRAWLPKIRELAKVQHDRLAEEILRSKLERLRSSPLPPGVAPAEGDESAMFVEPPTIVRGLSADSEEPQDA